MASIKRQMFSPVFPWKRTSEFNHAFVFEYIAWTKAYGVEISFIELLSESTGVVDIALVAKHFLKIIDF